MVVMAATFNRFWQAMYEFVRLAQPCGTIREDGFLQKLLRQPRESCCGLELGRCSRPRAHRKFHFQKPHAIG